jgi:hypothetical protein
VSGTPIEASRFPRRADLRPNAALNSVTVTAFEDENGFARNWFMRSHAIGASQMTGTRTTRCKTRRKT